MSGCAYSPSMRATASDCQPCSMHRNRIAEMNLPLHSLHSLQLQSCINNFHRIRLWIDLMSDFWKPISLIIALQNPFLKIPMQASNVIAWLELVGEMKHLEFMPSFFIFLHPRFLSCWVGSSRPMPRHDGQLIKLQLAWLTSKPCEAKRRKATDHVQLTATLQVIGSRDSLDSFPYPVELGCRLLPQLHQVRDQKSWSCMWGSCSIYYISVGMFMHCHEISFHLPSFAICKIGCLNRCQVAGGMITWVELCQITSEDGNMRKWHQTRKHKPGDKQRCFWICFLSSNDTLHFFRAYMKRCST